MGKFHKHTDGTWAFFLLLFFYLRSKQYKNTHPLSDSSEMNRNRMSSDLYLYSILLHSAMSVSVEA